MSGKIKSRSAANADAISGGVSCDERILRDCHELYTEPDSGELADVQLARRGASYLVAAVFSLLVKWIKQTGYCPEAS